MLRRIMTVLSITMIVTGLAVSFMVHEDTQTVHRSIGKMTHTHYTKLGIDSDKEDCIDYFDSNRFMGKRIPVYVCQSR